MSGKGWLIGSTHPSEIEGLSADSLSAKID